MKHNLTIPINKFCQWKKTKISKVKENQIKLNQSKFNN